MDEFTAARVAKTVARIEAMARHTAVIFAAGEVRNAELNVWDINELVGKVALVADATTTNIVRWVVAEILGPAADACAVA